MSNLFLVLLVISFLFFFIGIISPNFLHRFIKKDMTRKRSSILYGSLFLVFFVLFGITAPEIDTATQNNLTDQSENQLNQILEQSELTDNISTNSDSIESVPSNTYTVVKVVDGDTIDVSIDGKTERIRLIGIDTPETVDPRKPVQCFGVEASNKAKSVLTGKIVSLKSDNTQGERDKYDRLLRYVFLADGTNFNHYMIKEGYAYEYTYGTPYKYQLEFKQAQKDAEAGKKGLWNTEACNGTTTTTSTSPSTPKTISAPTQTSSGCNPNYSGCLKPNAGDYDCASGKGDGPNYTGAVQVLGYDEYGLDRDGDGWGCEN